MGLSWGKTFQSHNLVLVKPRRDMNIVSCHRYMTEMPLKATSIKTVFNQSLDSFSHGYMTVPSIFSGPSLTTASHTRLPKPSFYFLSIKRELWSKQFDICRNICVGVHIDISSCCSSCRPPYSVLRSGFLVYLALHHI